MTTIKMQDLRSAGIGTCPRARSWCERNGFSFRDLRGDGIDVRRIEGVTDGADQIQMVIAAAKKREDRERNG